MIRANFFHCVPGTLWPDGGGGGRTNTFILLMSRDINHDFVRWLRRLVEQAKKMKKLSGGQRTAVNQ